MTPERLSDHDFQALLSGITKPGQYLGNEVNAVKKEFSKQKLRVCLIFPDAYEMGMSNTGLRILYAILNEIDGIVAERCFAPGKDLEKKLREQKIPLFSLESRTPLSQFDIIGISLPYELTYTNVLNILDLAGIPLWQKDRQSHHPLILGGGTQSYNPEPVADFFDALALGDGEELILDVAERFITWKEKRTDSRTELLESLISIQGLYIPSFFKPEYHTDGKISRIKPLKTGYENISKRVVADLNKATYPTKFVVPNIRLIHDRIGIEIQRGCTRMCRFCQAGYVERPTRQRSPERVLEIAEKSLAATGLDEISLLSLSAGDYATIVPTLKELNARYLPRNVSISVPATRTETLTPEMIEQVAKARKTGFTIAPEAGSERMRRVINKGNKVEDLMNACKNAFSAGYRLIKFYYMCGLPFETDEDVVGIAHEAGLALDIGHKHSRHAEINVSVSSFVPKPFTPFQWAPQMTMVETERKHRLVRQNLKSRKLNFKHHDARMSYLEGLFARGDRRLASVVMGAFKAGCRFDEWEEHFDFTKWQTVLQEQAVDLDFYLHRERDRDEVFPWDHLFSQMRKDWLWQEYENARKEAFIEDCSTARCADFCGACDFKTIKNRIFVIDEKPLAVKKGNREAYGRFGNPTPPLPLTEIREDSLSVEPPPLLKLRCTYSKTNPATFFGHLDLIGFIKRALLRLQTPVAYTVGFHPQIRLTLGAALPVGVESECESFDVYLQKSVDPAAFTAGMNAGLPEGLRITQANFVDFNAPAIYPRVTGILYDVHLPESVSDRTLAEINDNLQGLLNGREFYVQRQPADRHKPAKRLHLNRLLGDVELLVNEKVWKFLTLVDPEATLKPSEVIMALSGINPSELSRLRVRKTGVRMRESSPVETKF